MRADEAGLVLTAQASGAEPLFIGSTQFDDAGAFMPGYEGFTFSAAEPKRYVLGEDGQMRPYDPKQASGTLNPEWKTPQEGDQIGWTTSLPTIPANGRHVTTADVEADTEITGPGLDLIVHTLTAEMLRAVQKSLIASNARVIGLAQENIQLRAELIELRARTKS